MITNHAGLHPKYLVDCFPIFDGDMICAPLTEKGYHNEVIAIDIQNKVDAGSLSSLPKLYDVVCELLVYVYEALHCTSGESETLSKF